MKVLTARTVRFAKVVEASGAPRVFVPWTNPKRDPEFQRAVRQRRVMTVKQPAVGTKRDFGLVGFFPESLVSFLVFPKSLQLFEGARVVGIRYDLLAPEHARSRKKKK